MRQTGLRRPSSPPRKTLRIILTFFPPPHYSPIQALDNEEWRPLHHSAYAGSAAACRLLLTWRAVAAQNRKEELERSRDLEPSLAAAAALAAASAANAWSLEAETVRAWRSSFASWCLHIRWFVIRS